MSHSGPTPNSEPSPLTTETPHPGRIDASGEAVAPAPARPFDGRSAAITIGAGFVAGAVSWLVGEMVLDAFVPPLQTTEMMGQIIMKARFEDQSAADFKNAILAFSILGGVLGAAMGAA